MGHFKAYIYKYLAKALIQPVLISFLSYEKENKRPTYRGYY